MVKLPGNQAIIASTQPEVLSYTCPTLRNAVKQMINGVNLLKFDPGCTVQIPTRKLAITGHNSLDGYHNTFGEQWLPISNTTMIYDYKAPSSRTRFLFSEYAMFLGAAFGVGTLVTAILIILECTAKSCSQQKRSRKERRRRLVVVRNIP